MRRCISALFLIFSISVVSAYAQTSAFSYQGRFTDAAVAQPTNGTYSMTFRLYDAVSGGSQIGSPITTSVTVVNGVFTVQLDFGAPAFTTTGDRFLEVEVNASVLTPRQQITSAPFSVRAKNAEAADSLSASCNLCVQNGQLAANSVTTSKVVNGTVTTSKLADEAVSSLKIFNNTILNEDISPSAAIDGSKIVGSTITNLNASNITTGTLPLASGGTGATTAAAARTNLGISGTTNVVSKFTATGLGNSLIQDNGTSVSVGNFSPLAASQLYTYRNQLTANGDGQHTLYGYRTRDSQNDGTGYGQAVSNTATAGYTFWGDVYTFGVGGWSFNDYTRTGGVLGAEQGGTYWGSLGYRSSGSLNYGVYGSSAYASGTGFNGEKQGIGGGFYGGMIGSWSRGEVMGQVNSGEMFATYNMGNVYTSGFTADMVSVGNGVNSEKVAAFAVTATSLKVYDNGSAVLDGESVFVPFESAYASMLGETPDVTVSAVGSPAQLYIKSIEKTGFTVASATGKINAKFSWIAVGNRVDSNKASAIPNQIVNGDFENQLKDVMFNDGNKQDEGKTIWWDGSKVRFDKAPERARPEKTEIKPNN